MKLIPGGKLEIRWNLNRIFILILEMRITTTLTQTGLIQMRMNSFQPKRRWGATLFIIKARMSYSCERLVFKIQWPGWWNVMDEIERSDLVNDNKFRRRLRHLGIASTNSTKTKGVWNKMTKIWYLWLQMSMYQSFFLICRILQHKR